MFDDGAVDRLTGASGVDWFLANMVADGTGRVLDQITDVKSGESANDIDQNTL